MAASRVPSGSAVGRGTPYLSREPTLSGYNPSTEAPTPSELNELEDLYRQNVLGYDVICSELGIIPSSYVERVLWTGGDTITMTSHGLGAKGSRALAVVLVNNTYVKSLLLADNNLCSSGARAISQMLSTNITLSDVDLSDNNIREDGLKSIFYTTVDKRELKTLKLSGNPFTVGSMKSLQHFMENNICLTELCLSNCDIDSELAVMLGMSLSSNDTLLALDLSWNKIRGRGAVAIANGLKENRGLLKVNLAWNGFNVDGCQALEECLKKNKTLIELDLVSNRINAAAAACIIRGVQKNKTLEILKMGNNPLASPTCTLMLKAIGKMSNTVFRELQLKDIEVNDEFMDELAEVRATRDLIVQTGPLLSRRGKRDDKKPKLDSSEFLRSIMEGEGGKALDTMLQKEFVKRSEQIHQQILEAKRQQEARRLAEEAEEEAKKTERPVNSADAHMPDPDEDLFREPTPTGSDKEGFTKSQHGSENAVEEDPDREITSALDEGPDENEVIPSVPDDYNS